MALILDSGKKGLPKKLLLPFQEAAKSDDNDDEEGNNEEQDGSEASDQEEENDDANDNQKQTLLQVYALHLAYSEASLAARKQN